jgi:hypothetical protein
MNELQPVQFVLFMSLSMLSLIPFCFAIQLRQNGNRGWWPPAFAFAGMLMLFVPLAWG